VPIFSPFTLIFSSSFFVFGKSSMASEISSICVVRLSTRSFAAERALSPMLLAFFRLLAE